MCIVLRFRFSSGAETLVFDGREGDFKPWRRPRSEDKERGSVRSGANDVALYPSSRSFSRESADPNAKPYKRYGICCSFLAEGVNAFACNS